MKKIGKFPTQGSRISRAELDKNLEQYSRSPFQEQLARLITAAPDDISLLDWAAAYPDKWAAAVSIMARLAGYKDESVVINNNHLHIGDLSDAELLQKLQGLRTAQPQISSPALPSPSTIIENEKQKVENRSSDQSGHKKRARISPGPSV